MKNIDTFKADSQFVMDSIASAISPKQAKERARESYKSRISILSDIIDDDVAVLLKWLDKIDDDEVSYCKDYADELYDSVNGEHYALAIIRIGRKYDVNTGVTKYLPDICESILLTITRHHSMKDELEDELCELYKILLERNKLKDYLLNILK